MNELELTALKSENKESKIEVFGVVDLDSQFTFALKVGQYHQTLVIIGENLQVVITTPTSTATGYYLLPDVDFSEAKLSVQPTEVCNQASMLASSSCNLLEYKFCMVC